LSNFPAFSNPYGELSVISTGSLRLDRALAIGGIPTGQIIEICGNEGSGKTTLCQSILAEAQKLGRLGALIDSDHTFEPRYAMACGVRLGQLFLVEPISAEQVLETSYLLAQSGALAVIIIDSLTSMATESELESPYGEPREADLERLLSLWLPQLVSAARRHKTAIIFTNQNQTDLSHVYHGLESHLARLALPMAAALRLKLHTCSDDCEETHINHIQVEIIKNKFAPCSKPLTLDIIINKGFNKTGELIDLGQELNIITRKDAAYYLVDTYLGCERAEIFESLAKSTRLADELEQAIRRIKQE
jgi:recombination protein RecA